MFFYHNLLSRHSLQPSPPHYSHKVRLEYHIVYRIYSALLNTLDVLCFIPRHLTSLSDRLRVTFVCQCWCRTIIQHATLWSKLYLTERMDRLLVQTLLRCTKWSPLDITTNYVRCPICDVMLLSPFTQKIRSLEFKWASLDQVEDLSKAIFGPLPLLDTLKINSRRYLHDPGSLPTHPLFKHTANLKNFILDITKFPSLCHFTFPNLTTLNFSTC